MPTTSYPSDFNSAAVAEESTPPDMATTTLVSCGRPSRSRLLSMVPVIKAIVAASSAFHDQGAISAAEKLPFNIGRIPVRQSRRQVLRDDRRQILPPGRNGCVPAAPTSPEPSYKILK